MNFKLCELPFGVKLSISLLMLVCIGGYVASGAHMQEHHQNRDEREGLSLIDIEGAYHGVTNPSALALALENGHPSEIADNSAPLPDADRAALLEWLGGTRIAEDYDSFDLDPVPADVLDFSCAHCHTSGAAEALRSEPYLQSWDQVRPLAFARDLSPVDTKILLASTHAHALALGTITLLIIMLMYCTRWPQALRTVLIFAASAGLFIDLIAWWVARESAGFIYAIIAGGAAHAGAMVLMMILIIIELLRPGGSEWGFRSGSE